MAAKRKAVASAVQAKQLERAPHKVVGLRVWCSLAVLQAFAPLIIVLFALLAIAYQQLRPGVSGPATPPEWTPLDATKAANASIFSAEDFLSAAEVAHVLRLVESSGGWMPSATGGKHYEVPRVDTFEPAVRADPILRRIEERIAEHTGLPSHPHEDMVSLARITSEGSEPRGGHFPPFGLHHDTDTRPARVWTILVYLQLPLEGGFTIFPLRGANGRHRGARQKAERHDEFKSGLMQHFGGVKSDYRRHVSFDRHAVHPFMDLLEESCRGEYGVHFRPERPGGALMFESARRGGNVPNRLNWHGGCNVLQGTKVILQKFKELPFDVRRDKSWHVEYKPM